MEIIEVKLWKKLLGSRCKLCTNCRYLEVYEDGKLILEDGKICQCWAEDPSQEEWTQLMDDIQVATLTQMYE